MPEGPSIVILKEELEDAKIVGKEILKVSGTATIDFISLQHQKIKSIKTWGKHLLVCFKDFTLVIRLVFFGTYRINNPKPKKEQLGLHFKHTQIDFYTCTLSLLAGDINDHYDFTADVMSENWDEANAISKMKHKPKALICDLLLEQSIFAGVGNIIKNEVLYRAKVHPLNKIASLPLAKLKLMTKESHDYSFEFLKYKKEGTLQKHWLAYDQKICKRCNLPFKKGNIGQSKRVTYYCNNCQIKY